MLTASCKRRYERARRRDGARGGRRRYLLAAAVLAATVAGCGSTTHTSAPGGSASTGSGGDIVIGDIGAYSGVFSTSYGVVPSSLAAWADATNAAGGILGRHVRFVNKDVSSGGPSASLTATTDLIQQDHVAAILDFDANDVTWVKYAASHDVPVIAGLASEGGLLTSDVFPTVATPSALAYGMIAETKTIGSNLAIAYAVEQSGFSAVLKMYQVFGASIGVKIGVTAGVSSTAPDYTAFCQELKQSQANVYLVGLASAPALKLTDQCNQQGVTIPQLLLGPTAVPQWKSDSAFNGDPVIDGTAPYFDTSIPAVKSYRDALSKYEPSVPGSNIDNPSGEYAWAAGQMLELGIKEAGSAQPTAIQAALYTVKDETLGGLIVPVTYTKDRPTKVNCWFDWQIKDHAFVAPHGDTPQCAPAAAVAPFEVPPPGV